MIIQKYDINHQIRDSLWGKNPAGVEVGDSFEGNHAPSPADTRTWVTMAANWLNNIHSCAWYTYSAATGS